MSLENLDLASLQDALAKNAARWQAGKTPLSDLSDADKRIHLGAVPPPGTPSLQEREATAAAHAKAVGAPGGVGYPDMFDWRNVGGESYITPITDQGGCGSCVAFGSTATVEAMVRIGRGNPNYAVDLSEAHLFYCYAAQGGYNCESGWWPDMAFDAYKSGVVDEACFPYTAGDQSCNLCSDWQSRLTMISGWHTLSSVSDMKTWIANNGPLDACFSVYNDFFSYTGGIYTHVSGDLAGGHCISIVGYDDVNGCWICKNSWGPGWGESGFFRIAYGQCGIDATMWAAEGIVATGWERGATIIGLWAIDQANNAWVYADKIGWRKIAPDNDNIFYDLLSQLVAAKATGSPVDFYEDQGIIKQIAVW